MSLKKFVIEICVILLGITLTESIEKLVTNFTIFSLIVFLIIIFLSVDFFFAKMKLLAKEGEDMSSIKFGLNIIVLLSIAFMPFFMNVIYGILATQIVLRVTDIILILINNNGVVKKEKNSIEFGWLIFDITYLATIIVFIIISKYITREFVDVVLITIYFIMIAFETIYDFIVNWNAEETNYAK